jgi:fructose-1,6-bisphosphatase I
LAFIVEQAGGKATDGFKRILELDMKELHQRTPLFLGSADMVDMANEYMKKYSVISTDKA